MPWRVGKRLYVKTTFAKKDERVPTMPRSGKRGLQAEGANKASESTWR